ncbi:PfkB family carbohydrate kinase [Streptomyces sp. N2-109]|uniref:PfkB family carbohydrate kinase n=1 Tax=Streptomyces gossypii TaxID=2883101 RepID=A0ABT2JS34_9ACTN|nr:PfkB family carbohydrate kinase [Streptomyces gossypii]MCT2590698.1 PfkB family carbohydrate kinase [Streptomyces gossypii]
MTRVVFVGVATADVIAVVDHHPTADERIVADDLVHGGGGPAATAAVTAARLGLHTELICTVGSDARGHGIAAELAAEGVGTRHLHIDPDVRTPASVVISSLREGARAICTLPVPPLVLQPEAEAAVRKADWVHVDHLGWPAVAALLADVPPGQRPRLSVDDGNPVPSTLCRPADVQLYVPTVGRLAARYPDAAARAATPDPGAAEAGPGVTPAEAALLAAAGAQQVVATDGARGALGRDADGTVHRVPARPVQVVSTLGAGDVFHGALLTGIVRDLALPEAMAYAADVAALSCRAVDGRSAIPGHHEVTALSGDVKEFE